MKNLSIFDKPITVELSLYELIQIKSVFECWTEQFDEEHKQKYCKNDINLLDKINTLIDNEKSKD